MGAIEGPIEGIAEGISLGICDGKKVGSTLGGSGGLRSSQLSVYLPAAAGIGRGEPFGQ